MADISDVLDAAVAVLAGAFYPNGTRAECAIPRTVVELRPGWPTPNRLETAVKTGQVLITVFPPPNLERDRTRALSQWLAAAPPRHVVTATVSGDTVTIGGQAEAGQNVGLIADDVMIAYPVQPNDTLAGIAAGLAALLTAQGRQAGSLGPVLTVPGTHRLQPRIGGAALLMKEVERTDRSIMVSIWASSPEARTAAGKIVRRRLSDPKFISLVDGSAGWIRYDRTNDVDTYERADLYARHMSYWVEYGQYDTTDAVEVILPQSVLQPSDLIGAPLGSSRTTTS